MRNCMLMCSQHSQEGASFQRNISTTKDERFFPSSSFFLSVWGHVKCITRIECTYVRKVAPACALLCDLNFMSGFASLGTSFTASHWWGVISAWSGFVAFVVYLLLAGNWAADFVALLWLCLGGVHCICQCVVVFLVYLSDRKPCVLWDFGTECPTKCSSVCSSTHNSK